jgi:lipoate-protein ligase A
MAVDEALLDRCAGSRVRPQPTIRLYGWSPACLSLGRSQTLPAACDPRERRPREADLVRRPTGGLAVLHDREWTYSIVGRTEGPPLGGSVLDTYHAIAGLLLLALGRLGVDAREAYPAPAHTGSPRDATQAACFEQTSAHEITVGGRKLVGSAQARRGDAFLQHGSILLRADSRATARAIGSSDPGGHGVDLVEALGRRPDRTSFERALVDAVRERFGVELRRGRLADGEATRAARLRAWKYLAASWTLEGRIGERERRWGLSGPTGAT